MPNFSGIWTVTQQMQAKGASTWPATPGAPTIGTATAGSGLCASVTFTAPACTGYPAGGITGYRVISTPGCFSNTGASSPIVVSGLSNGTSYTFKAQATNATGYGDLSAASNSITASSASSQSYTTAGTYSWVAPSCVTSVSVVSVGAGGGYNEGGGGGGLAYKNNISVTPGNSYSVVVGAAGGINTQGGSSSFTAAFGTMTATGGKSSAQSPTRGGGAPSGVYDGGGTGGTGGSSGYGGGGGAGGYSGNGGNGGGSNSSGSGGSGGAAGGGSGGGCGAIGGGGGGGVGILGQGSSGCSTSPSGNGGKGGSSGANGTAGQGGTPNWRGGNGGAYGGGAGGGADPLPTPGGGAVRIVWPGNTRQFPSTCVGAP